MVRVAHRGGAGLAPENTLAAFSAGIAQKADAIELDIHLSKDGRIMVIHDSLLLRTTGQEGAVKDYTYEELQQFNAAANYNGEKSYGFQSIPALEDVLDLAATAELPELNFQIEIKLQADGTRYQEIEKKLVHILQERGLVSRTVIISFDAQTLHTIKNLEPELSCGFLISKAFMEAIGAGGPEGVAKEILSQGFEMVGIKYLYLTDTLYTVLRSYDLDMGVWVVNEPDMMRHFIHMGVDFITTDRPDILAQVLSH